MSKRCAIVGTAQSWRQTPWDDPSLEIWSLNDAYSLGLPRADVWFEQHPLDRFWYRKMTQTMVDPRVIPPGHYVRPEGHLEWLRKFATTNRVYLQGEPPDGWPQNAQRFPLEDVEALFGKDYWACGPSYMFALAVLQGYTEIWITGIHLATQHEYIDQRPNWEHLLGRALGVKAPMTVKNGFRHYDGNITIVLPESCPILTHGWKYAYEPKPQAPRNPYLDELKAAQKEMAALAEALIHWPAGRNKQPALERLARLKVIVFDCEQQMAKGRRSGTLVAKLAA